MLDARDVLDLSGGLYIRITLQHMSPTTNGQDEYQDFHRGSGEWDYLSYSPTPSTSPVPHPSTSHLPHSPAPTPTKPQIKPPNPPRLASSPATYLASPRLPNPNLDPGTSLYLYLYLCVSVSVSVRVYLRIALPPTPSSPLSYPLLPSHFHFHHRNQAYRGKAGWRGEG